MTVSLSRLGIVMTTVIVYATTVAAGQRRKHQKKTTDREQQVSLKLAHSHSPRQELQVFCRASLGEKGCRLNSLYQN